MDASLEGQESLTEVIAHLDTFERDMLDMTRRLREYRHMLFAAMQAQGLDSEAEGLVE